MRTNNSKHTCYVVSYYLNITKNNHNLDILIILKIKPLKKLIN